MRGGIALIKKMISYGGGGGGRAQFAGNHKSRLISDNYHKNLKPLILVVGTTLSIV